MKYIETLDFTHFCTFRALLCNEARLENYLVSSNTSTFLHQCPLVAALRLLSLTNSSPYYQVSRSCADKIGKLNSVPLNNVPFSEEFPAASTSMMASMVTFAN